MQSLLWMFQVGQRPMMHLLQLMTQGLRPLLSYGFSNLGLQAYPGIIHLVEWGVGHGKVKLHKQLGLEMTIIATFTAREVGKGILVRTNGLHHVS